MADTRGEVMLMRRMRWPLALIGALVAVWVTVAWAFRSRRQGPIRVIRRFNRAVLNPVVVRFSGRRGVYAATLHHVGRRSGAPYATPVIAHPAHGGYVIPLPYGSGVDWLHNLLAAGRALLDVDGRTVSVDQPAVVGLDDVAADLPPGLVKALRFYGTAEVVAVRSTGLATPASA